MLWFDRFSSSSSFFLLFFRVSSRQAHYGPEYFGVPNFSVALAHCIRDLVRDLQVPHARVLDLGCAAGRGTFELARTFDYALGLDVSTRFFRLAVELQKAGAVRYALRSEAAGDLSSAAGAAAFGVDVVRRAADVGLTEDVLTRTEFLQADACNLDARYRFLLSFYIYFYLFFFFFFLFYFYFYFILFYFIKSMCIIFDYFLV